MNLSEKLILAGLAVSLLCLPSCSSKSERQEQEGGGSVAPAPKPQVVGPSGRNYVIHVRKINGNCYIDIKELNLWSPDNQTVQWESDDPQTTYTAHFVAKSGLPNPPPGTPFDDSSGKAKHDVSSADPPQKPARHGNYRYSVSEAGTGTDCIPAKDPGIYIKP